MSFNTMLINSFIMFSVCFIYFKAIVLGQVCSFFISEKQDVSFIYGYVVTLLEHSNLRSGPIEVMPFHSIKSVYCGIVI